MLDISGAILYNFLKLLPEGLEDILMKRISRVIAAVLAALLMLSAFAGCHQKDAVVATYSANGKTYKLTSGQYAYAMILAESEGRNLVTEKLTDEEKKSGKEIDFYKKTIEKKKFADWVTDRAEELCREYFTIASSFDKYKLELSDSDKEGKDSYLSYQWQMRAPGAVAWSNCTSSSATTAKSEKRLIVVCVPKCFYQPCSGFSIGSSIEFAKPCSTATSNTSASGAR